MAEDEKQQKLVKPSTVVASGLAAMVAALFTSKLGIAGTLIGTALTAMTINLGSAVLSAQLEKVSTKVSVLPTSVRDRITHVRVPGKQDPEPAAPQKSGLLSRLRAIPEHLKNLPSARRRSVLLAGAVAGLAATVIGLAAVTGVEAAAGETFSCLLWDCEEQTASSGAPDTSVGTFFGGGPSEPLPPADAPGEQLPAPNDPRPPEQQPGDPAPRPGDPVPPDPGQQPGNPAQPDGNPPPLQQPEPAEPEEAPAPGRE